MTTEDLHQTIQMQLRSCCETAKPSLGNSCHTPYVGQKGRNADPQSRDKTGCRHIRTLPVGKQGRNTHTPNYTPRKPLGRGAPGQAASHFPSLRLRNRGLLNVRGFPPCEVQRATPALPRGLLSWRYGGAVGVTLPEWDADSSGERSSTPSAAMTAAEAAAQAESAAPGGGVGGAAARRTGLCHTVGGGGAGRGTGGGGGRGGERGGPTGEDRGKGAKSPPAQRS